MNSVYQFGEYRLNGESRLLTCLGKPIPLTPKTFELLLLLLDSQGRALSRDELIGSLWRDTFVEEANLSFQISSLRKALGDRGASYIETLPRHGYRFACPVNRSASVPSASIPDELGRSPAFSPSKLPPLVRRWYWPFTPLAMTLAALAMTLAALWLIRERGGRDISSRDSVSLPLTSYSGHEIQPSLSPDGSQVAFSWNGVSANNFDIYVKLVGPGEPLRLTKDPAQDQTPAWAPDGRFIAFLRYSTEESAAIYLIPALGGPERKLGDVTTPDLHCREIPNLTWSPDSKYLALGCVLRDSTVSTICLLPVDTGQPQRRLTSGVGRLGDYSPKFSPDGSWLAFIRSIAPNVGDVYVQRLTSDFKASGEPRRLTFHTALVMGLAWAADGKSILYSVGPRSGSSTLHVVSFRPSGEPNRSVTDAVSFGEGATALSVSAGNRVVYAHDFWDSNIWRVELSARTREPTLFISSTLIEENPDYSPDGKRVAYSSTQSGYEELWTANSDGSHSVQLTDRRVPTTTNPRWSPDGKKILFNSSETQSDIYTIEVENGIVKRLTDTPENELETRWSRDGEWIFYSSDKTGRFEIYKMPAKGGSLPIQITHGGGLNPVESRDGLFLYYAKDGSSPSSIWKVPVVGGREVKVLDGLSYSLNFAVADAGIYFLSLGDKPETSVLELYDLHGGTRSRLLAIDKGWFYGMALSPDQHHLCYSVIDRQGSGLMLAQYPSH